MQLFFPHEFPDPSENYDAESAERGLKYWYKNCVQFHPNVNYTPFVLNFARQIHERVLPLSSRVATRTIVTPPSSIHKVMIREMKFLAERHSEPVDFYLPVIAFVDKTPTNAVRGALVSEEKNHHESMPFVFEQLLNGKSMRT